MSNREKEVTNYRQYNGNNYHTDYVPQEGEFFMGDAKGSDSQTAIWTYNARGLNEEQKKVYEAQIKNEAPEGSEFVRHKNGDGSETFILKVPMGRQRG